MPEICISMNRASIDSKRTNMHLNMQDMQKKFCWCRFACILTWICTPHFADGGTDFVFTFDSAGTQAKTDSAIQLKLSMPLSHLRYRVRGCPGPWAPPASHSESRVHGWASCQMRAAAIAAGEEQVQPFSTPTPALRKLILLQKPNPAPEQVKRHLTPLPPPRRARSSRACACSRCGSWRKCTATGATRQETLLILLLLRWRLLLLILLEKDK